MNKLKNKIKKKLKNISYKDIIIFLIPFIMFEIYLIILYPGVLSYDSYNQINQIKAMTFNTDHPFFHTFIEMVLMRIFNSPSIVAMFQILVFSFLWSSIIKYNRNKYSEYSFGYEILLTVIICLNPINKLMSITLWKDVLYSYMILYLSFEIEKLIDKKFKVKFPEVLKLSFLLMLIPNLRHNGYLITLIIPIILVIVFIKYDKKSFNYLKLLGLMFIFFFSFKGLEKLYNVEPGMGVGGIGGVIDYRILAITGEIGRYGNYTVEDAKNVNKYIDFECMKVYTMYNALDGMWVYCGGKPEEMSKNRLKFYKEVFSMSSRNIGVVIKYFLKEWGYVWRIVRYSDSFGNINYYGYMASNASPAYVRPFENTKIYNLLAEYMIFTRRNVIFQTIFYSGSLCLYLSIIILIYLKKKRNKGMFLVFLPTLVNTIGIALTASVNDVRYYYSNFLVLYLLGAIFIRYWLVDDKK